MTMNDPHDDMLDDLFATARKGTAQPGHDLIARVLADADALQSAPAPQPAQKPGLWTQLMEAIGGWPAVSGLATATIAGVWIGVAPPAAVEDLTATLIGDEVGVALFSGDLLLGDEGLIDG
ncbi:MAG: hypothetical protein AAFU41_10110 [Pseudomonadota bacterium]